MGGKKGQTIGYHYMFDILFGLGRGPWNELTAIKVADKIAWEGPLTGTDVQAIKKPDLFGGEKKEGGIQGPFRVFWGDKDQVLPGAGSANCSSFAGGSILSIFKSGPMGGVQPLPAVKTAIGGLVSEFRGTTMLWFSGLVTSLNPYPKAWSFRGRRYSAGWYDNVCWYPAKSVIYMSDLKVYAMNPAHIIFQCFTDPQWGRGFPWSRMGSSFIYAANKLCAEGFGLCFVWQRKEQNVDDFIDMVCDYIGATWYTDPETGKIELCLIRSDYDPESLPLFTPTTGLLEILDEDSTGTDEIFSEFHGTGRDPITNEDFTVRAYNLAARISQGAPNSADRDYKGIPTRELMGRVLLRDLKMQAAGLKKYKVTLDRRGFRLRPGMPFRIADPRRNLGNVILRAGQIDDKSFKDGRITISAMQDVYGLPSTSFVGGVESSWTPPTKDAAPAAEQHLFEANYRDLARSLDIAVLNTLTPTDSILAVVASSPDPAMYQYDLESRAAGESNFTTNGASFTGVALLSNDITALQTSFVVNGEHSFNDENVGEGILCDGEQMALVSYDIATHTVTVKRGCGDSVPQPHSAGARLWTVDDDMATDGRRYVSGETVEALVLTRTAGDVLDPADATLMTETLVGRQAMPFPPAKVTVDGIEALTLDILTAHAAPVIDWAHRDRLLQMDQLLGYTEASIGPEPGTTYTIRVYDALAASGSPPLRTVTGIVAGPWTYDATMQTADGSPNYVAIELESERDGLISYQRHRFTVTLTETGYGFDYGGSYGG